MATWDIPGDIHEFIARREDCFQLVLNKNLDHHDRTRWVPRGTRPFGLG